MVCGIGDRVTTSTMLAVTGWALIGATIALPRMAVGDIPLVAWAARLFVASVFVVAGGRKLLAPRASADTAQAYQVGPAWLARAFGYGLPYVEFAVGVALLWGVAPRAASYVAVGLLIAFTAAIVTNLVQGRREINCGCFGTGVGTGERLGWPHVARNAALAANAVVAGVAPSPMPAPSPAALTAFGIVGSVGLTVVVLLWQIRQLMRMGQPSV
jgi:uncharacterized membrane protein YphA (DoxX/SURF4 family)